MDQLGSIRQFSVILRTPLPHKWQPDSKYWGFSATPVPATTVGYCNVGIRENSTIMVNRKDVRRDAGILHFMVYCRLDSSSIMACCDVRKGATNLRSLNIADEFQEL